MIGNDLVFFQNNTTDLDRLGRKFEKILHPSEQFVLNKSFNAKHFSIVWSIKETGYKAMQRNFNFKMKLNPHEMQIISYTSKDDVMLSQLAYKNKVIEVTSLLSVDFVYSFTGKNLVHQFNFTVPNKFKKSIELLQYKPISLVKNKLGLPYVEEPNLCIPISKTHDRDFIAYCWKME